MKDALKTITCKTELKLFSDFSVDDKKLINIRCNITLSHESYICRSHEKYVLHIYAYNQRSCCDPKKNHTHPIKNNLREVSLDYYYRLEKIGIKYTPGEKLCTNCIKHFNDQENINTVDETCNENLNAQKSLQSTPEVASEEDSPFCTPQENALEFCNSLLKKFVVSPIKLKGGNLNQKINYGTKKLNIFTETFEEKIKKALDLPSSSVLNISPETKSAKVSNVRQFYERFKKTSRGV